jgi:hypothetical protein
MHSYPLSTKYSNRRQSRLVDEEFQWIQGITLVFDRSKAGWGNRRGGDGHLGLRGNARIASTVAVPRPPG